MDIEQLILEVVQAHEGEPYKPNQLYWKLEQAHRYEIDEVLFRNALWNLIGNLQLELTPARQIKLLNGVYPKRT